MVLRFIAFAKMFRFSRFRADCFCFKRSQAGQFKGIVIDVKESGTYERSDRSFIDYDEIDSLFKGIDYISKVKPENTRLANFEAIYATKGDLKVVTFSSSGKEAAAKPALIPSNTGRNTPKISI